MRTLALHLRKDLSRWTRDPVGIALWAVIPLSIALLLKLAFGGPDALPRIGIAVVDRDQTVLTEILLGAAAQGPAAQQLELVEAADSTAALRLLKSGDVSAVIFFPEGFTETFLDGETARVGLMKHPAQRILPEIVAEGAQFVADGGFYLREVFADPLAEIRAAVENDADPGDVGEISGRIGTSIAGTFETFGAYLFPPVVELQSDAGEEEDDVPSGDFLALFFPGVIVMTLLLVGQPLALDLWEEHKQGTFRRTYVSASGATTMTMAKAIAAATFLLGICALLLVSGRYVFRLPLESIGMGALFSAVIGFAVVGFLQLLVTLPRTENGGVIFSSLLVMPLIFLGGSFFPFEAMPPFLRSIGEMTPNGMALIQLKRLLAGTATAASMLVPTLICLAVGLLFSALAGRQVRRRFLGE